MAKGGGSQPTNQTVTQTNIGEAQRPYYNALMQRASTVLQQDYVPYGQERIADFTPQQQALQQQAAGLQAPPQFAMGTNFLNQAAQGTMASAKYDPTAFNYQTVTAPAVQQYSMTGPADVAAQNVAAQDMQAAQSGYTPNLQTFQMGPIGNVGAQQYTTPQMGVAQTGYRPDVQAFEMGPASNITTREYMTPEMRSVQADYRPDLQYFQMEAPGQFSGLEATRYMSPYIQQALEPQMREAITSAKRGQLAEDLGAVRQGTYGGSRKLLAAMERERNLGQQLGDIQARGMQSAYENAQQQFERDRAAQMQAQQANLQAKLGVQSLGTDVGARVSLANLDAESQARVQNLAAQLQTQGLTADQALKAALANQQAGLTVGQQNVQSRMAAQQLATDVGSKMALANLDAQSQANVQNLAAQLQTQGLNADQALRAALANQQMQFNVGQQNLQSQMATQELGAQQGLQVALANLSNEQQARVNNQALQFQAQGMNAENALRAALANQQTGLTVGQQNLQSQLATQQLGVQTGLQALLANQQANLDAQRASEQSRQFGAQNALQAYGQMGQYGQTAANIAAAQQNADIARLGFQQQSAAQQQALNQQRMDLAYQDYLRQMDYPYTQLQRYGNLLSAVPQATTTTQTGYAQSPSLGQQIMGTGLTAAGLYNMYRGG